MNNSRYIEFDSTYRNRQLWPEPSEFEVLISQSGRKGKYNADDPVSLATPLFSWTSNRVDASVSGVQLTAVVDSITLTENIAAINDSTNFVITSSLGNLQQLENYYENLIIVDTTIGVRRRIKTYTYIGPDGAGNDRAAVAVSPAFPDTFSDGDSLTINDPTDISYPYVPLIFVPAGRKGDNAYSTCILYNETRNDYRNINAYSTETNILSVDAINNPVTWASTDSYSIRKEPPLTVSAIAAGTTTNSIVLTSGSNVDEIYTGQFIRIRASTYGNSVVAPQTEIRRIIFYDGSTLTALVDTPFSSVPSIGDPIEIIGFSYDNHNPFVYSGSLVSQQEMTCYEIELLNVILPNKTLNTSFGGRIAFYQYLYVELSNVSAASAGMKNVIYSNNPNSVRMVFRATIDDTSNPIVSSFIKIDGDGMVQTLKFKPNDNLRFSVRFPDGSLFRVREAENYSPSPPNPEIQISALFSIRRVI